MSNEEKKNAVALLLAGFLTMPTMAIAPLLAEIGKSFPSIAESQIQLVMTLPAFAALLTSFVLPVIAGRIQQEVLLRCSLFLEIIGGLLPLFFHTHIAQLYASSAILGIGMGGLTPVCIALVAEHISPKHRNAVLGYLAAASGLGATVLGLASGYLARWGWQYGYLCYALAIPVLMYVTVFFHPVDNEEAAKFSGLLQMNKGFLLTIIMLVLATGFVCMAITVYPTSIASYYLDKGWGGTDTSGVASSLYTASMILSGLLFGKLFDRLKQYTFLLAVCLSMAGMLIVLWGANLYTTLFGGSLIGFSYTTLHSSDNAIVSSLFTPTQTTKVIALLSISTHCGNTISPLVFTMVANSISGDIKIRFALSTIALLTTVPVLLMTLKSIKLTHNQPVHVNDSFTEIV